MASTSLHEYPLAMVRGDTYEFTLSTEGVTVSGVTMTVRDRVTDAVLFTVNGTSVTGGYKVRIAPATTASLTPGVYKYDVQVTVGTDKYTPLLGSFTLVEDQTRS